MIFHSPSTLQQHAYKEELRREMNDSKREVSVEGILFSKKQKDSE